jgi:hypothetical protein
VRYLKFSAFCWWILSCWCVIVLVLQIWIFLHSARWRILS